MDYWTRPCVHVAVLTWCISTGPSPVRTAQVSHATPFAGHSQYLTVCGRFPVGGVSILARAACKLTEERPSESAGRQGWTGRYRVYQHLVDVTGFVYEGGMRSVTVRAEQLNPACVLYTDPGNRRQVSVLFAAEALPSFSTTFLFQLGRGTVGGLT